MIDTHYSLCARYTLSLNIELPVDNRQSMATSPYVPKHLRTMAKVALPTPEIRGNTWQRKRNGMQLGGYSPYRVKFRPHINDSGANYDEGKCNAIPNSIYGKFAFVIKALIIITAMRNEIQKRPSAEISDFNTNQDLFARTARFVRRPSYLSILG